MRGVVDQLEKAIKGKNRRLIVKYRDSLENKLDEFYSELSKQDKSDSASSLIDDVEKLVRDAIYSADECEARMQEGEEAANVAKVTSAQINDFSNKVQTLSQWLETSPKDLISDVDSEKAWGVINDSILQKESFYKEMGSAYVSLCQCVTGDKDTAIQKVEEEYKELMSDYVEWMKVAQKVRSSQCRPIKVSGNTQGACDLKIQPLQLPVFRGEMREYARFRREFAETVEKRFEDPQVRCLYLQNQCLQGPAKDLVKGLSTYAAVVERLDQRYGRSSVIICEILRELDSLKVNGEGEQKCILKLSNFLQSAWDDLDAVNATGEFCNVVTLQTIEGKMMSSLQNRWAVEKETLKDTSTSAEIMVKLKGFIDHERKLAEKVMVMQGKVVSSATSKDSSPREKGGGKFTGNVNGANDGQPKGKGARTCYRCGKSSHFVRDCRVPRSIKCRQCGDTGHIQNACPGKDNGKDPVKEDDKRKEVQFNETNKEHGNRVGCIAAGSGGKSEYVRLPIEKVRTQYGECNALWDSGSTLNLVSRNWVRKNNVTGKRCRLKFNVVDGTNHDIETSLHSFKLKRRDGCEELIRAYELESIATAVTPINIMGVVSVLNNAGVVITEDEIANPSGEVELLLGSDCLPVFPKTEAVVGKMCVMSSNFGANGFFLAGSHDMLLSAGNSEVVHSVCFARSVSIVPMEDVCAEFVAHVDSSERRSKQLDFWTVEGLGVQPPPICRRCKGCKFCSTEAQKLTLNEAKELDVIKYNLEYVAGMKRWKTCYPFLRSPSCLRDNYREALKALERREAKLLKDDEVARRYSEQVRDFVARGVLRKLTLMEIEEWTGPVRYVDHRHIFKAKSTTPVRLVINSSFSRRGELSLNTILMKGPNILNCLFEVLLRWRMWPVAYVGDISKMYHNVMTGEVEGHVRRLLWREYEINRAPDVYVFQTVTFGDRPAGCIVMSALRRTAEMFGCISERAASVIIEDSYMDDVVSGAYTREEALKAIEDIQKIAAEGGFTFKKFTISGTESGDEHEVSVLGIRWRVAEDQLSPNVKVSELKDYKDKWNRRRCLSLTGSVYDPLGFCAPITVRLKILMKTMFISDRRYKLWDTMLESNDQMKWNTVADDLQEINNITVSRACIPGHIGSLENCSLIGFCDASSDAMCAVIYCRYDGGAGDVEVSFVAAKTRVSPVKSETMPRLELCGALLLSRLMMKCRSSIKSSSMREYFLCDSKIVLGQLTNTKRLINDFVGVRVLEVRSNSSAGQWAYVPTEENVADLGTRGGVPTKLAECWFTGPSWLRDPLEQWPVEMFHVDEINGDVFQVTKDKPVIDAAKYSSLARLNRVTAVCLIFAGSRGNGKGKLREPGELVSIKVEHLEKAEMFWLKEVNKDSVRLYEGGKLSSLRPALVWNEQGKFAQVVTSGRVGSVVKVGYDVEELPILDPRHPYVKLLLRHLHESEHASDDKVLWKLRVKFWVPQARKIVRSIRKSCIRCRFLSKKLAGQIMAPLPKERVLPSPPWTNVSVDLFGPFECKDVVKKRMKVKVWGIIFTCLVSRASHLDVTSSYGTDSVLQALRRFISVRGSPQQIVSDQGSQMVGCSKEIDFLLELVNWDVVEGWCTSERINWKLVPPQAQHMNGCSEALIRVTKKLLAQRLEGIILSFEELQTVFFEVANILNSRPLGIYARPGDDPLDGGPITPNHLLMGRATSQIPQFKYTNVSLTKRVKFIQEIVSQFWNKWHIVAFPSLVPQYKWRVQERNMCVGDVVLMKDESASPGVFKLGQISGVRVSDDGCVRSVTVRYVKSADGARVHGYASRPVHKLVVILPVDEQ